jgi:hypothetical protein
MTLRVVAWAWAAVAVAVWLLVLGAGADPEIVCPDSPQVEGSSIAAELTPWPPGAIECTFVSPDGDVMRSIHVPWEAWVSALLFAAGAGCAAMAPFRRRSRLLFAAAAALLVPGAIAVWFL